MVKRGRYEYREFLWPGSVVDELYDVAEELMEAFDWPSRDAAMLFVLTGEAPMVQPVEARWERKQGTHLNPHWRIRLTIPPWLPESEVLGAYRQMRRQISGAKNLPKKTTPSKLHASFGSGKGRKATRNAPGPNVASSGVTSIQVTNSRPIITSARTSCVAPRQ